jgi:Flp pilus assembly protein TadD
VYQLQGIFALEENDAEAAAEHLEKALTANPSNADNHFLLAAAKLHQNKLQEAREHYRASLRHRPSPKIAEKARRAIALINEQIGVEAPSSEHP